jgi:hypothetical protein
MQPLYIVLFIFTVISTVNIIYKYKHVNYNPDKEIIRIECVDGNQVAMNDNGYRRPLLDGNNNPIKCEK